jgi:hypothetical protein
VCAIVLAIIISSITDVSLVTALRITVDVMLETNLDALIEPGTSFLAPRDHDKLLENCLWNGFMAAEPGHSILARAIEHVLRTVLTGGSEAERFILAMSSRETTEIWKLRATSPNRHRYLYSGCALGVAMNQVLRKDSPVQDLDLGKQSMPGGGGDLLILMVSALRAHVQGRLAVDSVCTR